MTNCSTGKEAMRRKSDPSWHHERKFKFSEGKLQKQKYWGFLHLVQIFAIMAKMQWKYFQDEESYQRVMMLLLLIYRSTILGANFPRKVTENMAIPDKERSTRRTLLSDSKNIFEINSLQIPW